jgi:hypothetical protein
MVWPGRSGVVGPTPPVKIVAQHVVAGHWIVPMNRRCIFFLVTGITGARSHWRYRSSARIFTHLANLRGVSGVCRQPDSKGNGKSFFCGVRGRFRASLADLICMGGRL